MVGRKADQLWVEGVEEAELVRSAIVVRCRTSHETYDNAAHRMFDPCITEQRLTERLRGTCRFADGGAQE